MQRAYEQLRLAVRSLARAPGFSITATLTLALGIGLSTAVFTIADAILIDRLPVRDQDRIVLLWGKTRDGRMPNVPMSLADIRAIERGSHKELLAKNGVYRQLWDDQLHKSHHDDDDDDDDEDDDE